MKSNNKENVLLYIFLVFILSSCIYLLFYKEKWLAILFVSCFFIYLFFLKRLELSIILLIFFLIPIVNNFLYYNLKVNFKEDIRIVSLNSYGGIGEIKERKVYVSGDFKDIKLGDRILAKIDFRKDVNIERGILGEVKIEEYEKLNLDLKGRIYRIREDIFNNLKEKLGSRRSALITSISFGYTEFLDREDENTMKNLGVLHAVSVSGLHMVIVYSLLKKFLGNKIAPILSIMYVIFTGAAISTVRSYIMLLCLSLAVPFRRSYNPLAGLSFAGIILILYKPYSIFEVGFQLSFLSTLGIILFNKKFNKDLYKLPKFLREGTAISLSSQVFTFPFLILYFREFSLGFLAGNLILMPLINAIVILGNILALTINFKVIFNYLAFLAYYATLFIDIISEKLLNILPSVLFLNEIIAVSYIIILITIYFYRKGYKRSIYFPMIILFYLFINFYSPYPKLQYYRDGVLLISYKGERTLVGIKKGADLEKYKFISLSNREYKSFKKIKLKNTIEIERINKNILITNGGNRYLIKFSSEKYNENYDIINCKYSNYVKIVLFKNKVLVIN
ncbi:MAG: ComEC/Rec2 family competence protein [Clostridium sp.]|nr:ComEC/Rec2 family competence protein [Clostridium sp.]